MMSLIKSLLHNSQNFFLNPTIDAVEIESSSEIRITKLTYKYIFSKITEIKQNETEQFMIKYNLFKKVKY